MVCGVLLDTAYVVARLVIGSQECLGVRVGEEFQLSCGLDVHVRVYGLCIDFNLLVDEVTEWEGSGGWGGVPDAMLLCLGEVRVLVGGGCLGVV